MQVKTTPTDAVKQDRVLLRPNEVCELLRVSRSALTNYVRLYPDELRPMRLSRRCTVFDRANVLAWLERRTVKAADAA